MVYPFPESSGNFLSYSANKQTATGRTLSFFNARRR